MVRGLAVVGLVHGGGKPLLQPALHAFYSAPELCVGTLNISYYYVLLRELRNSFLITLMTVTLASVWFIRRVAF